MKRSFGYDGTSKKGLITLSEEKQKNSGMIIPTLLNSLNVKLELDAHERTKAHRCVKYGYEKAASEKRINNYYTELE